MARAAGRARARLCSPGGTGRRRRRRLPERADHARPAHPFGRYYGSVDATPLFCMLLGAYARVTGDLAFVRELWPNACAALDWMAHYGDRDGDGYVEYQRTSEHGLVNQGWKDSGDAIFHRDGRLAEPPIALVEVQGYRYAA